MGTLLENDRPRRPVRGGFWVFDSGFSMRPRAIAGRQPRPRRSGFTLVELLTVVLIISILMGLVTLGVATARRHARVTVVGMEIAAMENALVAYNEKYGAYPPDFTDAAAVQRHLARCFPRYDASSWETDLEDAFLAAGYDAANIPTPTPATALVFWLGGLPDSTGRLNGFSANPSNPFDFTTSSRIGPFFEFDRTRLSTVPGTVMPAYQYRPDFGAGTGEAPYLYFRANAGGSYNSWEVSTGQWIHPYVDVRYGEYVNPRSVQIISAAADGDYGFHANGHTGNAFPTGIALTGPPPYDYADGSFDNVTNFSGGTLESAIP